MKCYNCGQEILNDSNFCEFCGTKVLKNKNKITSINYLVACLFLGLISLFGLGNLLDHHFIDPLILAIAGVCLLLYVLVLRMLHRITKAFAIISYIQISLVFSSAMLCYFADKEDFDFIFYPMIAISWGIGMVIYHMKNKKNIKKQMG